MFDLTASLHTHEAARLSGATKASARMIASAPEKLRPVLMGKHQELSGRARASWEASRRSDHGAP